MGWTIYMLRCADGSFYTGITTDLPARLAKHAQGTGAKYTKGRGPFTVVYAEAAETKSEALKRELSIKALTREQKSALILSSNLHATGADRR